MHPMSLNPVTHDPCPRIPVPHILLSPQQDLMYNMGGAVNTLTQTGTACALCPPSERH